MTGPDSYHGMHVHPDQLYSGAGFPGRRMRRNRSGAAVRSMVRETDLLPRHLILPLFVVDGPSVEVESLPGVRRLSIDDAVAQAKQAFSLGIPAAMLFPVVPEELRDDQAKEAINPDNLVCRAVRAIREAAPNMVIMADVALDPYTSHGHDGVMIGGEVENDATNYVLAQQALCLASAQCDTVAPSDMMDGRVAIIRKVLDDHGFDKVRIASYAVKYASALYGPFREAMGTGLKRGHKRSYQMDPANRREARKECLLDIDEGADILVIKPGLPYIDIVSDIVSCTDIPVLSYQVSGEYAMVMGAAQAGIDPIAIFYELLTCIRRAGASGIITYAALDMARHLSALSLHEE